MGRTVPLALEMVPREGAGTVEMVRVGLELWKTLLAQLRLCLA